MKVLNLMFGALVSLYILLCGRCPFWDKTEDGIFKEALASTLNEDEISDLWDQFDAIDVDRNGSISLEEMRQALAKVLPWKLKESRVLEILQAIDSNTDGLVDFTEFVTATLHVHLLEEHNSDLWQQRSHAACVMCFAQTL